MEQNTSYTITVNNISPKFSSIIPDATKYDFKHWPDALDLALEITSNNIAKAVEVVDGTTGEILFVTENGNVTFASAILPPP